MGASVSGAQVELLDTKGQTLATAQTNDSGNFSFPVVVPPGNYRVVARLGNELFATELSNYDGRERFVCINVATSLVSAFQATHPGSDIGDTDRRVHLLLGIPLDRSLEYGLEDGVRSPFSHIAFFVNAAAQGGWTTYAAQLLAQLENGNPQPKDFRLNRKSRAGSVANLNPELRTLISNFKDSGRIRLGLNSSSLRPAGDFGALILNDSLLASQAPTEVSPRIVDTIRDQIRDVVWTHIADGLNLNYGTTTILLDIQATVNEILDKLDSLSANLQDAYLAIISGQAATDVNTILTYSRSLATQDVATILANPETPYSPPTAVATLLTNISTFNILNAANNLATFLMPSAGSNPNIVTTSRTNFNNQALGTREGADWANFPLRTNAILDYSAQSAEYYFQTEEMAANLLGEASHVSSSNPAVSMTSGLNNAIGIINNIKKQRGQLPPKLMSDDIVVDMQTGIMWYSELQAADSVSGANTFANNFVLDCGNGIVFSDWHLAQGNELETIQDRGRFIGTDLRNSSLKVSGSSTEYGVHGRTAQGLGAQATIDNNVKVDLLFTGMNRLIDNDGSVLQAVWSFIDGGLFSEDHWDLNNTGALDPNSGFKFNNGNSYRATTDKLPFLMCRHIDYPCVVYGTNIDHGFPWANGPMQASHAPYLGYVSKLSSPVLASPTQVGCTVQFQVKVGGVFTMGDPNQSTSASYNLAQKNPTKDFSTLSNGVPNQLISQFVAHQTTTNDESKLTTMPNGRLFWHAQGTSATARVDFTALGANGVTQSISGASLTTTPPTRTLKQVQMFPRNNIFFDTNSPPPNTQYSLLGFYSDNTVTDLTNSTTWTLSDQNDQPIDPALIAFSQNQKGLLIIKLGAVPLFVKLKASIGSSSIENDQTTIKVITQ